MLLEGGDGRSDGYRIAVPSESRRDIVFQSAEYLVSRGGPLGGQAGDGGVNTRSVEEEVRSLAGAGCRAGLGYVQEVGSSGPFEENDPERLTARGSPRPRSNYGRYSFKQLQVGIDKGLQIAVADDNPEVDIRPSIGGPFPEAAAEPCAENPLVGLEDSGRVLDEGPLRQFGWVWYWKGLLAGNVFRRTISRYKGTGRRG